MKNFLILLVLFLFLPIFLYSQNENFSSQNLKDSFVDSTNVSVYDIIKIKTEPNDLFAFALDWVFVKDAIIVSKENTNYPTVIHVEFYSLEHDYNNLLILSYETIWGTYKLYFSEIHNKFLLIYYESPDSLIKMIYKIK